MIPQSFGVSLKSKLTSRISIIAFVLASIKNSDLTFAVSKESPETQQSNY